MDQMSEELTDDENYDETENLRVEVFPYKITSKNIDYWKTVIQDDWDIVDKIDLDDLIDDFGIRERIDWTELYLSLPEDIDDDITEMDDSEEEMESDIEETDSEIEEGEIVSDSET